LNLCQNLGGAARLEQGRDVFAQRSRVIGTAGSLRPHQLATIRRYHQRAKAKGIAYDDPKGTNG
jgi:hypothetical protein